MKIQLVTDMCSLIIDLVQVLKLHVESSRNQTNSTMVENTCT